MQLELHTFLNLSGYRVTIAVLGASIGQFCQIVSLKLDAVDLVVAAQFLYFLLAFLWRQRILPVLVGREFLVELLLRELLAPLFLSAKRLRDGEERHDRVVVQTIRLYLI